MAQDQGQAARSQGASASQRQRKNWLLRTQSIDSPHCKCLETRRYKGLDWAFYALFHATSRKNFVSRRRWARDSDDMTAAVGTGLHYMVAQHMFIFMSWFRRGGPQAALHGLQN